MKYKRNYGIDLIKIIACVMVITLHSLSPVNTIVSDNIVNIGLYYAGTLAIPIFFMASGYFVLNKKVINFRYSLQKTISILKVVLSWLLIYSLIILIIKRKFVFIDELKGSAFTGIPDTHFYHFWFFWSLIIMLLLAPIFAKLLQKNYTLFLVFLGIVSFICLLQDISLHLGFASFMKNTPQVFRLNIYIEYYLIGGLIGNSHFIKVKERLKKNFKLWLAIDAILYLILIVYSIWNAHKIGWVYAEANYNNILVMLISIISMSLFSSADFKFGKVIENIIPATMGIYIIHMFFIGKLGHIAIFYNYPVFTIPVVFIISFMIVFLLFKIPIIQKLLKL